MTEFFYRDNAEEVFVAFHIYYCPTVCLASDFLSVFLFVPLGLIWVGCFLDEILYLHHELYRNISFPIPFYCINTISLKNLLHFVSVPASLVSYFLFILLSVHFSSVTFLSMIIIFKVQGTLYYNLDYSYFPLNLVSFFFNLYPFGVFAFRSVHFPVFSLLLNGLIILALHHLKPCIYMGNHIFFLYI